MFERIRYLIKLSHAHRIARRYFVTNGFDGVLAMLGLLMGFRVTEPSASLTVMIGACGGTAVALFMSGITSAYISESAEKEHELHELEESMLRSLERSAHAEAAKRMPWLIAMVNGLSPLVFALLIILPMFMAREGLWPFLSPLDSAIAMAALLSFCLGVFLGRLSGSFWLWSGLRALSIAVMTAAIIVLINRLPGIR